MRRMILLESGIWRKKIVQMNLIKKIHGIGENGVVLRMYEGIFFKRYGHNFVR